MKRAGSGPTSNGHSQASPSAALESLAGQIERVTFHNEENGFCVLKVKAPRERELITVVGNLPAVSAGEYLSANGNWHRDRQFGLQFRAVHLQSSPPSSREGIEKYLASGLIKGIGPVYAKKLVSKFGEKIFDIIENYSVRLEEVDGIGPGRRQKIKNAWAEQKIIHEIMVFLHSNGVSTSRAVRIYKRYGEDAILKVRQDPYLLARDIHGIGFKSADQIASNLGIATDAEQRIRSGLHHILHEANSQGHTALPPGQLISSTAALLGLGESPVDNVLSLSLQSGELIQEELGGETLVFSASLRDAEEEIASRLFQLSQATSSYPVLDVDRAIEWVQARQNFALGESQKHAVRQALQQRILVITGGPGVGKTTITRAVLAILGAKKVKSTLCAPTGRAAKRLTESTGLEARTIHRTLEYQPGHGFARNKSNPLETDLVVLDEASMIDVPLFLAFLRAIPSKAHLLLLGDVDQLPSVGPGSVLSHLIDCGQLPVVRLTEIFRQSSGSDIISGAHAINRGELPQFSASGSGDFFFLEKNSDEEIAQTIEELVALRLPRKYGHDPAKDIMVLTAMNRGSIGTRELNARLQRAVNPESDRKKQVQRFGVTYRVGDRVIQTQNNYDKEVFNGDLGLITELDEVEQQLFVRFDVGEVVYEFSELDELQLAYSISIHKSQGSEFPVVIIPLAMQQFVMLQRNLIYTGVTRAKKLVVLVGQKKALQLAIGNAKSERRISGLLHRLQRYFRNR